jgi:hypothetical protein
MAGRLETAPICPEGVPARGGRLPRELVPGHDRPERPHAPLDTIVYVLRLGLCDGGGIAPRTAAGSLRCDHIPRRWWRATARARRSRNREHAAEATAARCSTAACPVPAAPTDHSHPRSGQRSRQKQVGRLAPCSTPTSLLPIGWTKAAPATLGDLPQEWKRLRLGEWGISPASLSAFAERICP